MGRPLWPAVHPAWAEQKPDDKGIGWKDVLMYHAFLAFPGVILDVVIGGVVLWLVLARLTPH